MEVRPGVYNIDLFQGEDFEVTLIFENDGTGTPFSIDSSSEVIMEVKENLRLHTVFKLVLGNGLTLTGENALKIFIAPNLTRKLSSKTYQYDILFLTESGVRPRYYIRGQINVTNTISRPLP